MTIVTLNLYIGVAALILTFLMSMKQGLIKSWWVSFLQNFCGILFIFSGFVKAIDPMGTAYKMEDYFKEFELTCKGSFLSFMSDLFPFLLKYAIGFSVFMIILEIMIGIMLILGTRRKLTVGLFFGIMVFFTMLTGFTYLTGYVPKDVNFFEFSKWTTFDKSFMRVTNCGCFGDFLQIVPKTSFFKDIFLMIPAILFLFFWKKCHELFTPSLRSSISWFSIVGLFLFSLSNFKWDEPMIDFRPFSNGTDIKAVKEKEQKAMADVEIVAWKLRNKTTNKIEDVPDKEYMSNLAKYPKTEFEVLDQVKSEPTVKQTKISDFAIFSLDGTDMTEMILDETRNLLIIVCPKIYYTSKSEMVTIQDTIYVQDTTWMGAKKDSFNVQSRISEVKTKEVKQNKYYWDAGFLDRLNKDILPRIDSLKADGVQACLVAGGAGEEAIMDLKKTLGVAFPFYSTDDILLKTIMRSNPGLVLMRSGMLIHKWHYRHIPSLEELRKDFLPYNPTLLH